MLTRTRALTYTPWHHGHGHGHRLFILETYYKGKWTTIRSELCIGASCAGTDMHKRVRTTYTSTHMDKISFTNQALVKKGVKEHSRLYQRGCSIYRLVTFGFRTKMKILYVIRGWKSPKPWPVRAIMVCVPKTLNARGWGSPRVAPWWSALLTKDCRRHGQLLGPRDVSWRPGTQTYLPDTSLGLYNLTNGMLNPKS